MADSQWVTGYKWLAIPAQQTRRARCEPAQLVLFLTSFLSVPLARQSCFDAALFTGFQVVGVTFNFLDDVLLLYLPLKPAQRVFERLAFLYANLCQKGSTSKRAEWQLL